MPSVTRSFSNNNIVVHYPTKEAMQVVTIAECTLIRSMPDRKVHLIKFIRDQYNLGLYEAKQVVDTILMCPDSDH